VLLFSDSLYQRNTNGLGWKSTGYVILKYIHTTCLCI
jgi:hypothetical protein